MKKLFILATAAVAFASCSDSDLVGNIASSQQTEQPQAVEFGTYMGSAATRADVDKTYTSGAIGNTENTTDKIKSLAQARFGVFSYLTTADYDPASTALVPNFMYDQELIYDNALQSTGAWYYTPVKYWPNGVDAANPENTPSNSALEKSTQKLSFFAYAPYMAKASFATAASGTAGTDYPTALGENTNFKTVASPTNGIVAMTNNNFTGNVWLKYMLPNATENEAVDLLWGLRGSASYSETDGSASTGTVGTDYNINLTKQTVDEKVKFLFKHALSQVQGSSTTTSTNLDEASSSAGISVKLDIDGNKDDNQTSYFGSSNGFNNAKTLVTIKSVKIQDGKSAYDDTNTALTENTTSDIYNNGWFNIETGTWDMTGATTGSTINILIQNNKAEDVTVKSENTTTYTLNPAIRENTASPAVRNATGVDWSPSAESSANGYTGGASGVTATAVPLFANEYVPGLMFIPGPAAQTLYVTVDYIVRTADANLANGFTEVEQIITNKVTLPASALGSNKIFKLIMHLGLTSVKFEAVVSDWQKKSDSTVDENGDETGGTTDNEKSIWLPSNVVAKTATTTFAAAAGTYQFEGASLNLGNVVSGTTTDPNITAVAKNATTATTADITVTENATAEERTLTTTITYELGTVTLNITQSGSGGGGGGAK